MIDRLIEISVQRLTLYSFDIWPLYSMTFIVFVQPYQIVLYMVWRLLKKQQNLFLRLLYYPCFPNLHCIFPNNQTMHFITVAYKPRTRDLSFHLLYNRPQALKPFTMQNHRWRSAILCSRLLGEKKRHRRYMRVGLDNKRC